MTKVEIMEVFNIIKPLHINEALYIIKERDPSVDEKLTTSTFNEFYKKHKAEVEAMMAQEEVNNG